MGRMSELDLDLEAVRNAMSEPKLPRPRKCEECGVNPADTPSRLCVGCDAYREHTGAF